MTVTDYLTYDDLSQHVISKFGLVMSSSTRAHVLTACRESYRRLFTLHEWNYFRRFELINLLERYTTGTVTYDAATRTLTLAGGTWPSAVIFGDVEIDEIRYPVLYRKSDTEVVLQENFTPAGDIATATDYAWTQNRYPLSFEVSDIIEIIDPDHPHPLHQIDVRGAMFLTDSYNTQTFPTMYTVFPSQRLPGFREVWFPSNVYGERSVKIMYEARHRPLNVLHKDGTTVNVSGQIATFPAGTLLDSHVGCVLRVSEDGDLPTSPTGRLSEPNQEYEHHPAEFERVIMAVDGNEATLSQPITTNVTDRAWSISSLIDTDSGSMRTLMMRLAEEEYTRIADLSEKQLNIARQLRIEQLIEAQTDDAQRMKPTSQFTHTWSPRRVGDIPSRVL